jgi:hypothetical protein
VILPPLVPGPCDTSTELFKTRARERLVAGAPLSVPYLIEVLEDPAFDRLPAQPAQLKGEALKAWRIRSRLPSVLAVTGDPRAVEPLMRYAAGHSVCHTALYGLTSGPLNTDGRVRRFAVQFAWERLFAPRQPRGDETELLDSAREMLYLLCTDDQPVPAEDALPFLAAFVQRFEEGREIASSNIIWIAEHYGKEGVPLLMALALDGLACPTREDLGLGRAWPEDRDERLRLQHSEFKAWVAGSSVRVLGKLSGYESWKSVSSSWSLSARKHVRAAVEKWWAANRQDYPADLLERAWESKLADMPLSKWTALPAAERGRLLAAQAGRLGIDLDAWQKSDHYAKAKLLRSHGLLPEPRNRVIEFPKEVLDGW